MITELLGIPNLGTGNILRKEVESQTDLGKQVEGYLTRGEYVPDALILEMVRGWLVEQADGWLLDGFPRTLAQAEALEDLNGVEAPTLAIALDVGREEIEKRMMGRRECEDCGNTVTVKDEKFLDCPHCGGALRKRSDDVLESFKVRFANYEELTLPLFDYYEAKGNLLRVNGSFLPDAVFQSIKNHLDKG